MAHKLIAFVYLQQKVIAGQYLFFSLEELRNDYIEIICLFDPECPTLLFIC